MSAGCCCEQRPPLEREGAARGSGAPRVPSRRDPRPEGGPPSFRPSSPAAPGTRRRRAAPSRRSGAARPPAARPASPHRGPSTAARGTHVSAAPRGGGTGPRARAERRSPRRDRQGLLVRQRHRGTALDLSAPRGTGIPSARRAWGAAIKRSADCTLRCDAAGRRGAAGGGVGASNGAGRTERGHGHGAVQCAVRPPAPRRRAAPRAVPIEGLPPRPALAPPRPLVRRPPPGGQ